jgi:hypothetical protein
LVESCASIASIVKILTGQDRPAGEQLAEGCAPLTHNNANHYHLNVRSGPCETGPSLGDEALEDAQ